MNIAIQIVCLLALVFTILAWYLSLMEFLVNLYIHRDNQLRGKKDEESDFVNTREMIKEDIVNFFKRITNVFKIMEKKMEKIELVKSMHKMVDGVKSISNSSVKIPLSSSSSMQRS